MKKLSKDDIISYVAVLVMIISIASIGMRLTGYANVTDTAVVNVTIDSQAALNFTVDFIDFSNGTVNGGSSGAILNTNGTSTIDGSWTPITSNLTLENIGNINLTLELYSSVNADDFLGGTNPEFQYMLTEDEANSCNGVIDLADGATYYEINTTNFTVCSEFPFADSQDQLAIDIRLYIPSDSYIGERTATITAVGQYS